MGQSRMKKLSLILTCFLSIGLLQGCEQEEVVSEPPLRTVRFVEVQAAEDSRVRTFTGVSRSAQEAKLSFKVSGTLTELDVAVGDQIEKGQTIARLDASTYQLQQQQAAADLTRAQAEERNANANYQRVRGLYENNSTSRTELDTARAAFESTKALVSASARAVELARLNVSYTRLIAKEDCSVATTSVEVGENIQAGQEVVLINCGESLNIDISVPESLISSFSPGMSAKVDFDAIPDQSFEGKVVEVGISATGTTFPITINLDSVENLRSGLAAQVEFEFELKETVPVIPVVAVSEDQTDRFVYLLTDGDEAGTGVVKRQTVAVGELTTNGIEIREGIQQGDRVIVAGISVIRDGMLVKAD